MTDYLPLLDKALEMGFTRLGMRKCLRSLLPRKVSIVDPGFQCRAASSNEEANSKVYPDPKNPKAGSFLTLESRESRGDD